MIGQTGTGRELTAGSGAPNPGDYWLHPFTSADGVSRVAFIDANLQIGTLSLSALGSGQWIYDNLSANAVPPVSGQIRTIAPYVDDRGVSEIGFQIWGDSTIRLLSRGIGTDQHWYSHDMTSMIGAPAGSTYGGSLSGYVRPDRFSSLLYTAASNNHLIELAMAADGSWYGPIDLTQYAGGGL